MKLLNLVVKHERRIRLIFDTPVALGALDNTLYSLTNIDGAGTTPDIAQVYLITNTPYAVELALSIDLSRGSKYTISAVGVPAVDASVTIAPSKLGFDFGQSVVSTVKNKNTGISNLYIKLYGLDILFDTKKGDFVERQDGDLLTISGPDMVKEALWKRVLSNGLPWNNEYGLKPREYVDGTFGSLPILVSGAKSEILADDRVESAIVTVDNNSSSTQAFLNISAKLIGQQEVNFNVPTKDKG